MKTRTTIRILLLGTVLGLLSGCASYPISKGLRQEAKPLTLAQVNAHPHGYTDATVIWGGQIVTTVNSTNGGSIYVLKLPLNSDGRPSRYSISPGRFIAHRNGFIDPEIFRKGQLITVAGAITGVKTQPLQKSQYTYPVIGIEELHLWNRRPVTYYYSPAWYWGAYGPGLSWGWYGPGWAWYGPGWAWGWGPGWDRDWD